MQEGERRCSVKSCDAPPVSLKSYILLTAYPNDSPVLWASHMSGLQVG